MAPSLPCVHIHLSILIEKSICDCQNVSIKLPCVYMCLSSRDLFILLVRVSSFFLLSCYLYFDTCLSIEMLFSNNKNYFKRKEIERHYLATIRRLYWSAQMMMKKDNKLELSATTVTFINCKIHLSLLFIQLFSYFTFPSFPFIITFIIIMCSKGVSLLPIFNYQARVCLSIIFLDILRCTCHLACFGILH